MKILTFDLCKELGLKPEPILYEGNGIFINTEHEEVLVLTSEHVTQCCEHHYLDFNSEDIPDDLLEFNPESFSIGKIEDYGIALIPVNGHPIRIPGYGENNGYYSSDLELVFSGTNNEEGKKRKMFTIDITECQFWKY